jgi:hypothetical protein
MLLLFQYRGLFENPQMFFNGRMAFTVRNGLLALAFGVLVLLVAGYGALLFLLVSREGWAASVGGATLLQLALATVIAPAGALTAYWLSRRAYRKSGAPEAFFFALSAATLSGEALLLVQAWLQMGTQAAYFTSLLTRAVWAFRFTGLFLLFCGSLFTFDFTVRKYGNLVGISVVAGILVASWLPLQSSARHPVLLALTDTSGVLLVTSVLGLVALMNFIIAAARAPSAERAGLAGAAACFLVGWAVVCLWSPWGVGITAAGAALALWKAEQTSLMV